MLLSLFFFARGVRQLLLSSFFPPAPAALSSLPVGVPVCNLRRWITVSIGLPAVVGTGDLLPLPKYAVRSFFMADLGFLGSSCSRSLCCFLLVNNVLDSQDVLKCVVVNDFWHVENGVKYYVFRVRVSDKFSNDSLLFFNEPPTLRSCQNRQCWVAFFRAVVFVRRICRGGSRHEM